MAGRRSLPLQREKVPANWKLPFQTSGEYDTMRTETPEETRKEEVMKLKQQETVWGEVTPPPFLKLTILSPSSLSHKQQMCHTSRQQIRSHCGGKAPKCCRRWERTLPENLKLSPPPSVSFLKGKECCPNTIEFSGQGRWAVSDTGQKESKPQNICLFSEPKTRARGDQAEPEDSWVKICHSLSDHLRCGSSWKILYTSQGYNIKLEILREKSLSQISTVSGSQYLGLRSIPVPDIILDKLV